MNRSSKQPMRSPLNKTGLLHLLVVYIVWGSTYLAIRVAVRDGSGFTPFMAGVTRAFAASAILLAYSAFSHRRLRITGRELVLLASMGALFWVLGNGLVMVGEQRADSGIAALIIASVPSWTAVIQAVVDRRAPSILLIGSLFVGLAGIALVTMPLLQTGVKADLLSVAALVSGSIAWAIGTVVQSRAKLTLSPEVNSGYQLLFGGIGFAIMALVTHEPLPHPTLSAWAAVIYLIVFGSLLAFTSYIKAIQLLPTKIVTTYGYVNPIIAVLLGWLILSERLSPWTAAGAALVLLSVTGVFRDHQKDAGRVRETEEAAVEAELGD